MMAASQLSQSGLAMLAARRGIHTFRTPSKVPPQKANTNRRFTSKTLVTKPLSLGSTDTLKISLTAKDNGQGKRPHQAFVILKEKETGLEAPFPLTVKESGKAVASIVRQMETSRFRQPMLTRTGIDSQGPSRPIPAQRRTPRGLDYPRLLRFLQGS